MINFYDEFLKQKENLLRDLKALCLIPSVEDYSTADVNQPFGRECRRALDLMLKIGQRDRFITDDCDGYAGAIEMGEGEETLGILGHLDVVPAQPQNWKHNAYDMTLDGAKLYGRGVADDKGPLLAAYYAAKIVNELDFPKKRKIRVIFGCNEETGSKCVDYYFKHRPSPELGFTPDADFPVVYGEKAMSCVTVTGQFEKTKLVGLYGGTRPNVVPDMCEAIVSGKTKEYRESFTAFLDEMDLKGSYEPEGNCTRLVVYGKSAHASTPGMGLNAITLMCHYLRPIIDHPFLKMIDDYFYDDFKGEHLGLAMHGQMGEVTANVGTVKIKNHQLECVIDFRLPHEISKERFERHIKSAVYGMSFEYTWTDALYVNPDSELIKKLHQAYVDMTHDHEHKPQAIGGGTYAKHMKNCVAFGAEFPGRDNAMHQADENIALDDLMLAGAIYAKSIYELIKS